MAEKLRPPEALTRDQMSSYTIAKRGISEIYFCNLVGKFKLNQMTKFISFGKLNADFLKSKS